MHFTDFPFSMTFFKEPPSKAARTETTVKQVKSSIKVKPKKWSFFLFFISGAPGNIPVKGHTVKFLPSNPPTPRSRRRPAAKSTGSQ
ncbi:MAG: hypothetical protein PHV34_07575 [Verrucomicrobiae bacterium]|nr:hypothetical protein [Verrucomicrobiae bacterium]